MRLLFISNVEAYVDKNTDVPRTYAAVAAHPSVELWHASAPAVEASATHIAACRVPPDFRAEDLGGLARLPAQPVPIDAFDLVFDRVLKPLPTAYLEALVRWRGRTSFVNDPAGITTQLDPRFQLRAAGPFMPPCTVTADRREAARFLAEHGTVVVKRPNSCGGRAVYRVQARDGGLQVDALDRDTRGYADLDAALDDLGIPAAEACTWVRYLHRVEEGDLRVVTLDGEPLGAYLRRTDGWIQNVGAGAHCTAAEITSEMATAIARTHRAYQDIGVRLLGYDFLVDDDGHRVISEINAGNIGGIVRIGELTGTPAAERFVDWLRRIAAA